MYLFDASAIVNLVRKGIIKPLANGLILDLALYESLNAIWKEHKLLKKVDKETALLFVEVMSDIFRTIPTETIREIEKEVFELALKEDVTMYDAAYLYTAIKNGLILVSDDEKLREAASRHIKTIKTTNLLTHET